MSRFFTIHECVHIFIFYFFIGWKRELVYSVPTNHSRRKCNVYYYSPSCQKLQSLKEIKEQLNVSPTNNNRLTIKSFTFLKRPVGINDESKELIRNVNVSYPSKLIKLVYVNVYIFIFYRDLLISIK